MSNPLTAEEALWVVEHPDAAAPDDLVALTEWADAHPDEFALLLERMGDEGALGARALPDVIDPDDHLAGVREQRIERGLDAAEVLAPATLKGLAGVLVEARAAGRPVRALGSFRSQSDVAEPVNRSEDAVLVALSRFIGIAPDAAHGEVYVEAGCNVGRLNDTLDRAGLALPNMGSGDFQTVVGAISTGTHGSGFAIGDLASLVLAVELLTLDPNGEPVLYRIRPTGSAVHSPGYTGDAVEVVDLPDDDAFHAAKISLGCLGIVFAVTLRVQPTYFLREDRVAHPWSALPALVGRAAKVRHFELLFNALPGSTELLATERVLTDGANANPRAAGLIAAALPIARRMGRQRLGEMLAKPSKVPDLLQSAVNCSRVNDFRRKSFRVLKLGLQVDGRAPEIGVPASHAAAAVADLRSLVARRWGTANDRADPIAFWRDRTVPTSPISMRWVARSSTFLSMQQADDLGGEPWVMFEAPMLVDPHRAADPGDAAYQAYDEGRRGLVRAIEDLLCDRHGGRAHWGLESASGPARVAQRWGAAWEKWKAQRARFDPFDLFRGAFTRRMGLTP